MVAVDAVVVIGNFVAFSLLGRRVEVEVCGFVGCLVVLGDVLAGLVTVLAVLFDNVASVLDPVALCTVWKVVRRVVCVVISTVVIVGFFVANFVVFLDVLAKVCVVCVLCELEITGIVCKIIDTLKLLIINLEYVILD